MIDKSMMPKQINRNSFFRLAQTATNLPVFGLSQWVLGLLVVLLSTSAFAQPQLTISGNGNSIEAGSTAFSGDNYTDFGSVFNNPLTPSGETVSRTFVLTNSGDAELSISSINLEDPDSFFELAGGYATNIPAGQSEEITLTFTSVRYGNGFAQIKINSNAANHAEYTFFVRGRNIECGEICFDVASNDDAVCSGQGSCTATDTCECNGLYGGTQCQIEYKWSDGGLVVEYSSIRSAPGLWIGSTLSDPDAIYAITIRIDLMNTFGVTVPHVGVLQVPPVDLLHHLGSQPNEYGYRANGNKIDSSNSPNGIAYGTSYEAGDSVQIRYNAQTGELSFAVQKGSEGEFVDQGVAYTIFPEEGAEFAFALSTTSFVGGVRYVIVE